MKRTLVILVSCIFFLFGCIDDNVTNPPPQTGIIGTWKLTETLIDPGGGATFQPVNSDKTIIFETNGTWTSNGDFCGMSTDSNVNTSGSYTYNSTQKVMQQTNCGVAIVIPPELKLELQNANELWIYYPCIEPCIHKFIRQ